MSFESSISNIFQCFTETAPDSGFLDFAQSYYLLTSKWGGKINITNNLSEESFIIENILEPWISYQILSKRNPELFIKDSLWADLGCGGGFVGLTWAFLSRYNLKIILLDSDRKKINFCKQVTRDLGLLNVEIIQERVEVYFKQAPSLFEGILSRATWSPEIFFGLCKGLCKPSGILVHFSSSNQVQALNDAECLPYELPRGFGKRFLSLR